MPIIQPTPIDQLPQPPNPADRSNFNSLAYPFTAAMLPMTEQINQAISDTYTNALEAEAKASEASVSAGEAHNSELAAQEAETLADGHKNAAAISAGQAGDSETVATTAAGQATLARDKARQWATATGAVEGDLKGAMGYAQDAAQSAQDAADIAQGEFGPAIHAATAKGTPADDDELAVTDSAASWELKKLTWSNLKAAIWAAFKTIATGGSAKATLGLGTAATHDVGTGDQELRKNIENDVRFVNTSQIKATTGQGAADIMSQKAVTDALANTGALAPPSATYEYDAQGRVDKIVTPGGNTVIGYNPDGTVETISYPTGRVETFTYDASGNVTAMTATGG